MTDAEVILLITEIGHLRKELKMLYRIIAELQEKLRIKNHVKRKQNTTSDTKTYMVESD